MAMASGMDLAAGHAEATALVQRLERCIGDASLSASLRQRARWAHATVCVGIGHVERLLTVDKDAISFEALQRPLQSWDFSVRGTARAWHELWLPAPKPGWHDIFALAKRGEMRIEGDLLPFMAHLQFFKDLLALPRAGSGA